MKLNWTISERIGVGIVNAKASRFIVDPSCWTYVYWRVLERNQDPRTAYQAHRAARKKSESST